MAVTSNGRWVVGVVTGVVVIVAADFAGCCCCEERDILVVVIDRVYGGLVLDIRGLDRKERRRKKTVPLVQSPAILGFMLVGLY